MDLVKMTECVSNPHEEDTIKCEGLSYFDRIPIETFLHICSFLDSKIVSHSLRFVCQRFHNILNDETYWKTRVYATYNCGMYPVIPVLDNEFNWQKACLEVECQCELWQNKRGKTNAKLKCYQWKDVHYAAVDAIHLLNNGSVCVSGGRDRSIVVWNLSELRQGTADLPSGYKPPFTIKDKAHLGWIWELTSSEDRLYSCSWDSNVSKWSLQQQLQADGSYKCESAVLTLAVDNTVLAAGLYNSKIVLFDVRCPNAICSYKAHRRSVLALRMDDKYIISASEDRTLALWDRSAGKILKEKIKLYSKDESDESFSKAYPLCMSYKNNKLYVGDCAGQLHLLYFNCGNLRYVKRTGFASQSKITCIDHGEGHIILGTAAGSVSVLTPTKVPDAMFVMKSAGGEVTAIAYQDNVLATSGTDRSVEIWIPSM